MTAETIPVEVLDECWRDLVEKTDRTSPEDYPDMALITREELGAYLALADRSTRPAEPASEVSWHSDDLAVDRFAAAMKVKLAEARAKGKGGWYDETACSQQYLSDELRRHVLKPDPLDVANFAMFLHQRGEEIAPAPEVEVGDGEVVAWMRQDLTFDTYYDFLHDRHHAERSAAYRLEGKPAWKVSPLVRLSTLEAERAKTAAAKAERDEAREELGGMEAAFEVHTEARTKEALGEEAARRYDDLKQACERAGVCMTCVHGHHEPAGCWGCRNTGWVQGDPYERADAAETALSRALQDRDEAVRVAVEDERDRLYDDAQKMGSTIAADWLRYIGPAMLPADRARLRADQRAGDGGEA